MRPSNQSNPIKQLSVKSYFLGSFHPRDGFPQSSESQNTFLWVKSVNIPTSFNVNASDKSSCANVFRACSHITHPGLFITRGGGGSKLPTTTRHEHLANTPYLLRNILPQTPNQTLPPKSHTHPNHLTQPPPSLQSNKPSLHLLSAIPNQNSNIHEIVTFSQVYYCDAHTG